MDGLFLIAAAAGAAYMRWSTTLSGAIGIHDSEAKQNLFTSGASAVAWQQLEKKEKKLGFRIPICQQSCLKIIFTYLIKHVHHNFGEFNTSPLRFEVEARH